MSDAANERSTTHEIARAEIDRWRGRCLDHYARTERVIGVTLEKAQQSGQITKLKGLAGQRFLDLESLIRGATGTDKQKAAMQVSTERWRTVEARRAYFAHGVVTALLDQRGNWNARFDLTQYKANAANHERWTIERSEALKFEESLKESFKLVSQQMGLLRKQLAP